MPQLDLSLAIGSFVAGFLMFLAPCTLPLVPAYIAFLAGQKESDIKNNDTHWSAKINVLKTALAFVFGFSIIFIVLGLLSGLAGSFVGEFKGLLDHISGLLILGFGLSLLGFFNFVPFIKNISFKIPSIVKPTSNKNAFFIGMVFALSWTPCIGPILATVLLFASFTATALQGTFLLAIFSLGFSLPFLLVAFCFSFMSKLIYKYSFVTKFLQMFGGVILVCIGLLLLTAHFDFVLVYGAHVINFFGLSNLYNFF